jgi:hypothetical protein
MSIIDHILKEKASSVYFELSRMLDEKASEIAAQYKSEFDRECFDDINESSLVGNQHKLDANKNGKLDGHDFKLLRAKDDKPPFDKPYSKTKVHKDEYGNVIRNVAKRLAKKAMNAQKMKEEADLREAPLLGRGMSPEARARDIEQSDREYVKQVQFKNKWKKANPGKKWPGWSHPSIKFNEEANLQELSKDLLNRYMKKNYQDRERLATGLPRWPRGEENATEKQKKDGAKLGKKVASGYLAHKKAYPKIWAKNNPPHARFPGDNPARVHATEETSLQELSKGLLDRYELKNERDRERLASGLWYPKGEAGATEKQKKDSAKLDKRIAGRNLASMKTHPTVFDPKVTGRPGARVHATEETVNENYERLQQLKRQMGRLQKQHDSIQGIHPDKKRIATKLSSLEKEHNSLFRSQVKEEDDKNLTGKQHKIDKNKNGKIDAHDFKLLRKEEADQPK